MLRLYDWRVYPTRAIPFKSVQASVFLVTTPIYLVFD